MRSVKGVTVVAEAGELTKVRLEVYADVEVETADLALDAQD